MKNIKILTIAATSAIALTALLGVGSASATGLLKYTTPSANDDFGVGTVITAGLEAGSTATLSTTDEKTLVDTCTTSEVNGKIENAGGKSSEGKHPSGKLSTLTFGGCSHTTDVLAKGELEFRHIAGTTNGTVISKGAEVTVLSTTFGVSCVAKTEGGTTIGTLTGAKSSNGQATIDVNGVIPTGFLCGGDSRWKGSYEVADPLGLTVEDKNDGNH